MMSIMYRSKTRRRIRMERESVAMGRGRLTTRPAYLDFEAVVL